MANDRKSYVVGVACTEFLISNLTMNYISLLNQAVVTALADCGLNNSDIQAACVRSICDESSCSESALALIGITGIPVCTVQNTISNGPTALALAHCQIKTGADCVLAVGLEIMIAEPTSHPERVNSPLWDGMAAVVICSKDFVLRNGLTEQAVEILGMEVAADRLSTLQLTKLAADSLYRRTGIRPNEVQVVEIHDCPDFQFIRLTQALGLSYHGVYHVANTSGGLLSTGSGAAQCTEICLQLRGLVGQRQVPYATIGLQHLLGIGGEVVVALYRKGFRCEGVEESIEKPLATGFYSGILDMKRSLLTGESSSPAFTDEDHSLQSVTATVAVPPTHD